MSGVFRLPRPALPSRRRGCPNGVRVRSGVSQARWRPGPVESLRRSHLELGRVLRDPGRRTRVRGLSAAPSPPAARGRLGGGREPGVGAPAGSGRPLDAHRPPALRWPVRRGRTGPARGWGGEREGPSQEEGEGRGREKRPDVGPRRGERADGPVDTTVVRCGGLYL